MNARASSPNSYIEPTESVSLPQGNSDTYSISEMSTSGTIAADPPHTPSSSSLPAYMAEQANSQPCPDIAEPSDECIQSMEEDAGLAAQLPIQSVDMHHCAPVQSTEDDACTTSSEIEVISACTSIHDEPMLFQQPTNRNTFSRNSKT